MGGFSTIMAGGIQSGDTTYLVTKYPKNLDSTSRSFGTGNVGCTVLNRHYIGTTGKPIDFNSSTSRPSYNIVIDLNRYYNYSWDYYLYLNGNLIISQLVGAGNSGSGTGWVTITSNSFVEPTDVLESAMHPWGPAASGAIYNENVSVITNIYTIYKCGELAPSFKYIIIESEIEEDDEKHRRPIICKELLDIVNKISKIRRIEFLRLEIFYEDDLAYTMLCVDEKTFEIFPYKTDINKNKRETNLKEKLIEICKSKDIEFSSIINAIEYCKRNYKL
ncbi:MAG: hypothetical protein QW607_05725 [Desulfurococcaceae archaeon]